jgi:biotin carboxyl carrier protein
VKLELNVDGQPLEADFGFTGGAARLVRGGETLEARVSEPEPGLFTVLIGSRVFRCAPETSPSGGAEIVVNGRRVAVAVRDPKRARRGAGADAAGGGRVTLVAPMPGKVVRVMCAAGDEVGAGQGLLVVEAMKMQNEVQSPRAGRVAEVRAREGQTVNAGEVLAVVE